MRSAEVYRNKILAGILHETQEGNFLFEYDAQYFNDKSQPAISLTLPKNKKTYSSEHLFPFFYNMLSEGTNKLLQCRQLKIDEKDHFGLLLATAQNDTIGAVTVKPESKS